jgi:hypothetical protein
MNQLRKGMWVASDLGIGILAVHHYAVDAEGMRRPADAGTAVHPGERKVREQWVHLTDANGDTLAQVPADRCANLRQARAVDLPQKRVSHLTTTQLANLGYL